jgi:short-subunit dehydrogenase
LDQGSAVKSVLITGCSSDIGLCLAEGLKQKGYQVFATARNDMDVEKVKKLRF